MALPLDFDLFWADEILLRFLKIIEIAAIIETRFCNLHEQYENKSVVWVKQRRFHVTEPFFNKWWETKAGNFDNL